MHHLVEIHAKAKSDDRSLQQEFREALAFQVEGVSQGKSVNESTQECDGR